MCIQHACLYKNMYAHIIEVEMLSSLMKRNLSNSKKKPERVIPKCLSRFTHPKAFTSESNSTYLSVDVKFTPVIELADTKFPPF